jgi:ankyrin repeat protein
MRNYIKYLVQLVAAIGISSAWASPTEDFFIALNRDDAGTVTRLLASGFDPNTLDEKGRGGLAFALLNEATRSAEVLLASPRLDVNRLNAAGESPLMIAALRGDLDWCKRLVARGAQVNHDGWSALHYAASGPNPAVLAWLLTLGANVEGRSPNGTTPLMMAAGYGPEEAVERLLAAKAEIRATNEKGMSAVDFARMSGRAPLTVRLEKLMPR